MRLLPKPVSPKTIIGPDSAGNSGHALLLGFLEAETEPLDQVALV